MNADQAVKRKVFDEERQVRGVVQIEETLMGSLLHPYGIPIYIYTKFFYPEIVRFQQSMFNKRNITEREKAGDKPDTPVRADCAALAAAEMSALEGALQVKGRGKQTRLHWARMESNML